MRALPTLRQLRHLVALADEGHFGRAAAACSLTQSSLSASIRELEATLGRTLVERTKRRVMVTPLGLQVVDKARALLADAAAIVDLVDDAGEPLSGTLRLGVIPTIAPFLLPRTLPPLRRAYPKLRLYLKEQTSAELVDSVRRGSLDAALMAFPYPTPGLSVHVFAEDPFWVALPRGHALAERERVPAAALGDQTLLLLEEGHCLRDQALSVCGLAAHALPAGPQADLQGSSLHTLVQMADNGLGLTFLPKMAIDAGIARGTGLTVRPLDGPDASRRIGLAWRPGSPAARDVGLLAGFLAAELATPLPPERRPRHTESAAKAKSSTARGR